MKKEIYGNCWDFWGCPEETKKRCRIYNCDLGKSCWHGDSYLPKCKRAFEFCSECPWYKQCNE